MLAHWSSIVILLLGILSIIGMLFKGNSLIVQQVVAIRENTRAISELTRRVDRLEHRLTRLERV